jgi:hypothetical protein
MIWVIDDPVAMFGAHGGRPVDFEMLNERLLQLPGAA